MIIGTDPQVGSQYVSSLENRYNNQKRNPIPTPWSAVNDYLYGGLSSGQLGIILAPPNTGKSWMLQNITAQALRHGKKVLFYTLQMSQDQVGQRIDVLFNKKSRLENYLISQKKNIYDNIKQYKDLLMTKQFLPNQTTIQDLKNHKRLIKLFNNFQPDMIVLDYGDIVKKTVISNNMYTSYGDIFTALKSWAKEQHISIWTGTQGTRCIEADSIVNIKNKGHIPIKEIQIGDLIQNPAGFNKVLQVHKEKQPVYKIKLKNGKEILCSIDHEFPTLYGKLKSIQTGLSVGDKLYVKKKNKIKRKKIVKQ